MGNTYDRVSETVEALQAARKQSGSPRAVTREEILYLKVDRFGRRPIGPHTDLGALISEGETLKDEATNAYFYDGGRPIPADMRDAIQAKIEEARAADAAVAAAPKNKGGRPLNDDSVAWWIEVVRIAVTDGELPSKRRELQARMDKWVTENCPDGGPGDSTTREYARRLYNTPGILP